MSQKIIIIGANHAGTACANQILSLNPEAELSIYDRNNNISFLGCGMALWIGNQISKSDGLFYSSKEALEKAGAKVFMETNVERIDFAAKKIYFKNKAGEEGEDSYDKLVLATGSRPVHPPIEGIDLERIQSAKLFQDAQLAVDQLENDPDIKKVAVVGAGYIGAELAEAYQRRGKEVVLIDALDHILGTHFDPEFSDKMAERLRKNGIQVELGQKVERFLGENGKVKAVVTNKGEYEVDLVLFCIGFKPNNELGDGKLETFKNGAFLVNTKQETSEKDVYAIGDCATVLDNSIQDKNYIALATNAVRSGIVAALNVSGTAIDSIGVQGSSGLCLYGLKMLASGLSVQHAEALGIEVSYSDFTQQQKPAFMDETGPNPEVDIRIVYRKDNHVVVGAQLMSEYDVSGIIHMFSLAIQEGVTIERLALLDIFFMPHFNQPYNYITMAALSAK